MLTNVSCSLLLGVRYFYLANITRSLPFDNILELLFTIRHGKQINVDLVYKNEEELVM